VGSKNAAYSGGTVTVFSTAKGLVEGKFDTTSSDQFVFTAIDKHFTGKSFSIPYSRILDLETGSERTSNTRTMKLGSLRSKQASLLYR